MHFHTLQGTYSTSSHSHFMCFRTVKSVIERGLSTYLHRAPVKKKAPKDLAVLYYIPEWELNMLFLRL
jgi:hypothetical protein